MKREKETRQLGKLYPVVNVGCSVSETILSQWSQRGHFEPPSTRKLGNFKSQVYVMLDMMPSIKGER